MGQKRTPIKRRVQRIVMFVALLALIFSSGIAVSNVLSLRNGSTGALTDQLEVNLLNTVSDKAALADAKFGKYEEYIRDFAQIIHSMYQNPYSYVEKEVYPPSAENKDIFAMQRYLRDEDVRYEDIRREAGLFGNLEPYWQATVAKNADVITTVYIGTETGLHIAYDTFSDIGVMEGSDESYFDYSGADWYTKAKGSGTTGFTDIYQDSYGRGMMISCYSSFYDKNNQFAGVVCMDMLISDIYQQIVAMDLGEEGSIYLVDANGNTVNPVDNNELESFREIIRNDEISGKISRKETGFQVTEDGVYYAYAPVESTGWGLCIGVPEDQVLEAVHEVDKKMARSNWIFLGAVLLLGAIITAISHAFSKSLTEPLIELGKDAQTISKGNLEYRAKVTSNDEIGDLAQNFNDMAGSLQQYIRDLTTVTAEKERIGAELNVATQIQADMLPRIFPPFPERDDFDIYASMDPAKEVGGDFYDFFLINEDHIALVMADVSGKGVPAALFMVIAKTLIKDHAQLGLAPADVFTRVNNLLCEGNEAGLFVTAWLGIINLKTGKGMAANAGHEHPSLRKGDGRFEMIKYKHSPALATMEGLPFREHEFELQPGDALFVYTDGVPEAMNAAQELFGEERTVEALNRKPSGAPEEILRNVKEAIGEFVSGAEQFDDITMLCFEYYGPKKQ